MVREIVRMYPSLGSFLYGHWEGIELSTPVFIILLIGVIVSMLAVCCGGIVGYALQSVGLVRIAKRQGAWHNIRVMACLPLVRYFAIGKIAERCDVQKSNKRRLWGKILLIVCCVAMPVMAVMLVIALIGVPGMQFVFMMSESMDNALENVQSVPVQIFFYLILVAMLLPLLLLNLISNEMFAFVMIALPIAGIVCGLLGIALLASIRTLRGICCKRLLGAYFEEKTALILTVIGEVTGVMPVILFVVSLKKTR